MVLPLPVGNALRIFVNAPPSAVLTRILRKATDTFAGQADPAAVVVATTREAAVLDIASLVNGTPYFYRSYYFNGSAWSDSGVSASGTPNATYVDQSVDVQSVVRDRIDAGMKVEIARGALLPQSNKISVLTAPPVFDQTRMPMVIVHLENEAATAMGIGDVLAPDQFDAMSGQWEESTGWLALTQLTVTCWSLNPDERLNLRRALRRVLMANKPVFESLGMVNVAFPMNDLADFANFGVPVYQVMCSFSCMAPVMISDQIAPVSSVVVKALTT